MHKQLSSLVASKLNQDLVVKHLYNPKLGYLDITQASILNLILLDSLRIIVFLQVILICTHQTSLIVIMLITRWQLRRDAINVILPNKEKRKTVNGTMHQCTLPLNTKLSSGSSNPHLSTCWGIRAGVRTA